MGQKGLGGISINGIIEVKYIMIYVEHFIPSLQEKKCSQELCTGDPGIHRFPQLDRSRQCG